jgi:hypothetical protein
VNVSWRDTPKRKNTPTVHNENLLPLPKTRSEEGEKVEELLGGDPAGSPQGWCLLPKRMNVLQNKLLKNKLNLEIYSI